MSKIIVNIFTTKVFSGLAITFLLLVFVQNTFSQAAKVTTKDSLEVNYNFIVAASQGDTKKVNEYINLGVNINFRDAQGGTALFYAVNNGHQEVVKTLLYYGINPNIGNSENYTPLMAACANGDLDMAQLLLYIKRTNINLTDVNHLTALSYAAFYGHFYIVDMLLFYDAKPNIYDKNLNSSLYYAALNGDTTIASRLLKAKANILHQNKDGISPIDIAISNNDTALFDLLYSKITPQELTNKVQEDLVKFAIKLENIYALNILLKKTHETDDIYLNKEIPTLAYISENKKLIKAIKSKHFKTPYSLIFTSFQSKFSVSFNGNDYMCYMGAGVRDSRYNLDINLRYGTRFNQFSVMKQKSDNVYYQLWEKRRVLGLQLRKNFLLRPFNGINIKPYVAVDFQGHWGKYKGYSEAISPNFHLMPEVGISFQNDWLVFDFSYQYVDLGLDAVNSNRLNFGLGFMIPFYDKPFIDNRIWL
jgi:ankyrin repeat protein